MKHAIAIVVAILGIQPALAQVHRYEAETVWRSNFGAIAGSGSAASSLVNVPELSAARLLLVGVLSFLIMSRSVAGTQSRR